MENQDQTLSIRNILQIGYRRKWLILFPLIAGIIIAYGVYGYLPKIYRATTLILVQPQKVPIDYVRPTITDTIAIRLNTITQEILSRTRLEKVIQELNLFPGLRQRVPLEEVVDMMRRNISVGVQRQRDHGQTSFTISYDGTEPQMVMLVTNKLASLFIEENLKLRESQAEGTSDFIDKELGDIEKKLNNKDEEIRAYKERHMGNLPQQLDANLRTLDRLHQQLWKVKESQKNNDDRVFLIQNHIEARRTESIQNQMAQLNELREEKEISAEDLRAEKTPVHPLVAQLHGLQKDLEFARLRYTERHPDIIALKKRIALIEPQVEEIWREQEAKREETLRQLRAKREEMAARIPAEVQIDPGTAKLIAQYNEKLREIDLQNKRLKDEEENVIRQIAVYQQRVEEVPKKEEELLLMTRDYELLKRNYQSLMDKKIQSRMFENLERRQQGEQFRILDPARVPETPFKPDFNRVMLIGAMLGLMSGCGLAYLRETWNQKFHTESEIENALGLRVIAVIPDLKEDPEQRKAA
jgi:polysaccharide chain length determinant protein (PEP-CTERM system associated)